MIDENKLNEIEMAAKDATPGPWQVLFKSGNHQYVGNWDLDQREIEVWGRENGHNIELYPKFHPGHPNDRPGYCGGPEYTAAYLALVDPTTILELIHLARLGLGKNASELLKENKLNDSFEDLIKKIDHTISLAKKLSETK